MGTPWWQYFRTTVLTMANVMHGSRGHPKLALVAYWNCTDWLVQGLSRLPVLLDAAFAGGGSLLSAGWCHIVYSYRMTSWVWQTVWDATGLKSWVKVYFKPEQQCATENEFLEKYFGFGRFFSQSWEHGNIRMFPWQLVLATNWWKAFWFWQ